MTSEGAVPTRTGPEDLAAQYRTGPWLFATELFDVYRGTDLSLDRDVHLRFLKPRIAGDAEAVERVFAAAMESASLLHPNLVAVYDIGVLGGRRCVVTEAPPYRLVDQHDVLSLAEVSRVEDQCRAGLSAAHEHGLLHGAIEETSIFFGPDTTAKLADVGLATAASLRANAATPEADHRALTTVFDKFRIPRRPADETVPIETLDVVPSPETRAKRFDVAHLSSLARARIVALLVTVAFVVGLVVLALGDSDDPPTPGRPSGDTEQLSDLPPEIPR